MSIPEDKSPAEHNGLSKATSAADWKSKGKGAWKSIPLNMPSGNTALCRRVGLEQFLLMGMIPNSLVGLMQAQIARAKGNVDDVDNLELNSELEKMLDDPDKLVEIIDMVDGITCFCVVEPTVLMVPRGNETRDEGALYVDDVDLEDKLYIFQWAVGGVEDVAPFREQLAKNLGPLQPGEVVGSETQSPGEHL